MKKIVILTVAILLVTTGMSLAIISGSRHDMTKFTSNAAARMSACQYCHTPHHANTANPGGDGAAPLWNRRMPTGSTYSVYGGGTTLSSTTVNQPGTHSMTCLSCHDGTIGLGDVFTGTPETLSGPDSYGNALTGIGAISATSTKINFGVNLTREHPVGLAYKSSAVNVSTLAGLRPGPFTNGVILTGKKWKIYGGNDGTGRVECGSCHDPHGADRVAGGATAPFLKDTKSTMCTDCHSLK